MNIKKALPCLLCKEKIADRKNQEEVTNITFELAFNTSKIFWIKKIFNTLTAPYASSP